MPLGSLGNGGAKVLPAQFIGGFSKANRVYIDREGRREIPGWKLNKKAS